MNRRELVGYIAEEIAKVLPDGEADLDGDDLNTVENTVEEVLKDATEAIDESNETEEEETT